MISAESGSAASEIIQPSLIVKSARGGGTVIKVFPGALESVAFVKVMPGLAILGFMDYSRDIGRLRCTLGMIGFPTESGASFCAYINLTSYWKNDEIICNPCLIRDAPNRMFIHGRRPCVRRRG